MKRNWKPGAERVGMRALLGEDREAAAGGRPRAEMTRPGNAGDRGMEKEELPKYLFVGFS